MGYHRRMKRQIAIVEDEPALRENYGAALARQGYQIKTYGNRKSAMAAFETHLPDLAIIDISLEEEAEGGASVSPAVAERSTANAKLMKGLQLWFSLLEAARRRCLCHVVDVRAACGDACAMSA